MEGASKEDSGGFRLTLLLNIEKEEGPSEKDPEGFL